MRQLLRRASRQILIICLMECVIFWVLFMMSSYSRDPSVLATQAVEHTQAWSKVFATTVAMPTITPWPDRTVGASALGRRELWRYHSEPTLQNELSAVLAGGRVILLTDRQYSEYVYTPMLLTALNVENGQLLWQTPLGSEGSVNSATHDAERLYLVSSFRVYAFDLNTGQPLWETEAFPGHTGYYFRPWDSTAPLHLYADTKKTILIDPHTGAVLGEEPAGELLSYQDFDFATHSGQLEAKDNRTGITLWQMNDSQPPQSHMALWPSFADSDVIFRTGVLTYSLSRRETQTGLILWDTEPVYISDFALSGDKVYILRQDNALVTLDARSGQVLDEVAISGPEPDLQQDYWVATQPPYLLVFFGNTSELIVFQML